MTQPKDYTFGPPPPYAPFPEEDNYWGPTFAPATQHLPDGVVDTEFAIVIVSRSAQGVPRTGAIQISLQFGARENPRDLTPEEATYVRETLGIVIRQVTKGQAI